MPKKNRNKDPDKDRDEEINNDEEEPRKLSSNLFNQEEKDKFLQNGVDDLTEELKKELDALVQQIKIAEQNKKKDKERRKEEDQEQEEDRENELMEENREKEVTLRKKISILEESKRPPLVIDDNDDDDDDKKDDDPNPVIEAIFAAIGSFLGGLKIAYGNGTLKIFDESGQEINPNELIPGKPLPNGLITFYGLEKPLEETLDEIYKKFLELGFDAKKNTKSLDNGSKAACFMVNFPSNYYGNDCLLTITKEQIEEAHELLKEEKNKEQKDIDLHYKLSSLTVSRGRSHEFDRESMNQFSKESRNSFIKEILSNRAPQSQGAISEDGGFAEMIKKQRESRSQENLSTPSQKT